MDELNTKMADADANQESQMPNHTNLDEDLHGFSVLRLNSFSSSSTDTANTCLHQPCTACGCSIPVKRPSPGPAPQQPRTKKLFLDHHPPSENLPIAHSFHPVLRRCISDPFALPTVVNPVPPPQSPSDTANMVGVNTITQWPPSVVKTSLNPMTHSPNSNERMRRIKARMRVMSQWCNEAISEPEEDECAQDNSNNATQAGYGTVCEEAVSVERKGECLIIHFKCPCGEGYQILLCGNSCFYRLL